MVDPPGRLDGRLAQRRPERQRVHQPVARPPADQPQLGGPGQQPLVDGLPLRHQRGVGEAPHLADVGPQPEPVEPAHQVRPRHVPVAHPVDDGRHLADHPVDGQGDDRAPLQGRGGRRTHQGQLQGADRGLDRLGLARGQLLDAGHVVDHGRVLDHLGGHPVEEPGRGGRHLGPDPSEAPGPGRQRLPADVPQCRLQLRRGAGRAARREPAACAGCGRTPPGPGPGATAEHRRPGPGAGRVVPGVGGVRRCARHAVESGDPGRPGQAAGVRRGHDRMRSLAGS